jgi:hypothetical protein
MNLSYVNMAKATSGNESSLEIFEKYCLCSDIP